MAGGLRVPDLDDYLAEPLKVSWRFSGRRQPASTDPGALAMPGGKPGANTSDAADTEFTGLAVLRWIGTGPQDWP